jgi:glycosyltransferase involved in cell wall biosynthesis
LVASSPELSGKTTVLYNPITRFTEEAPAKAPSRNRVGAAREFVVGIVGRVTPAKGHHVLLRALAKIPPGPKKLTLLVVGEPLPGCAQDQSYFRSLASLPSELGFPGRIVWAGHQDNPGPFYAVMDALALPSLFEEGMGLVLLEALSRGIPVIASQVGGVPELVEDGVNGFLVPPGDPPSLTAALNRFLDNPPLLRKMGEAARRSVDVRFSPDTFRREIRSLVGELCRVNPLVELPPKCREVASWK